MLKIDLVNEQVYGEPGPNLLIRGTKEGISYFLSKVKAVLSGHGEQVITSSSEIELKGLRSLTLRSSSGGKIVSKINSSTNNVLIDLDTSLWEMGLTILNGLDLTHGFQYFEFDDVEGLTEEANVIVDSLPREKLTN
ncbi:MAG: hypothetical protein KDD58_05505 [Bdellovibrionales bacterium]|nr:hypothetical protein [Bdellovibrionales bacterium]